MKRNNHNQEKEQAESWFRQFYNDWKPEIGYYAGAACVIAAGVGMTYLAWYYTMAYALWVTLLTAALAAVLSMSLTQTLVNRTARWQSKRREEIEAKKADDLPMRMGGSKIGSPAPAAAGA